MGETEQWKVYFEELAGQVVKVIVVALGMNGGVATLAQPHPRGISLRPVAV
jgi:hypothetical protein